MTAIEEIMAEIQPLDQSEITEELVMTAARVAYSRGYFDAMHAKPSEVEEWTERRDA